MQRLDFRPWQNWGVSGDQNCNLIKSHKDCIKELKLERNGMNIYRLRVFYEAFKGQQRIYMNFFSYEVNGKLHLIAINTSFCMCCHCCCLWVLLISWISELYLKCFTNWTVLFLWCFELCIILYWQCCFLMLGTQSNYFCVSELCCVTLFSYCLFKF